MSKGLCQGDLCPSGVSVLVDSLSRSLCPGGLCPGSLSKGVCREPPGIRKEGGMHPTLILSCVIFCTLKICEISTSKDKFNGGSC